jgi:hypothetical protein
MPAPIIPGPIIPGPIIIPGPHMRGPGWEVAGDVASSPERAAAIANGRNLNRVIYCLFIRRQPATNLVILACADAGAFEMDQNEGSRSPPHEQLILVKMAPSKRFRN